MSAEKAEEAYRTAVAALEEAQRLAGATPRTDIATRAERIAAVEAGMARVRELKEAVKVAKTRENFAGATSPFADACKARVTPELFAEIRAAALEIQRQRDEKAAARYAAKQTQQAEEAKASATPAPAALPSSPPRKQTTVPEVVVRRPGATR